MVLGFEMPQAKLVRAILVKLIGLLEYSGKLIIEKLFSLTRFYFIDYFSSY